VDVWFAVEENAGRILQCTLVYAAERRKKKKKKKGVGEEKRGPETTMRARARTRTVGRRWEGDAQVRAIPVLLAEDGARYRLTRRAAVFA
jgi:hypothetical protein